MDSATSELISILNRLPIPARTWVESLSWENRRYVLSLCHLLCAASPQAQAEFLDTYTADGLITKIIESHHIKRKVQFHLKRFQRLTLLSADTVLSEDTVRDYIRQFYIHSSQDLRRQPDIFLESALKLVISSEDKDNILNYILGFEVIKMLFSMSWLQHEKLYRLQHNQEDFFNQYIKPIQYAHRLNQVIVPKDQNLFFARRDYFVQRPTISEKKLLELAMVTFTAEVTTQFGFAIVRHPNWLVFDYNYIFCDEVDPVFADPNEWRN